MLQTGHAKAPSVWDSKKQSIIFTGYYYNFLNIFSQEIFSNYFDQILFPFLNRCV